MLGAGTAQLFEQEGDVEYRRKDVKRMLAAYNQALAKVPADAFELIAQVRNILGMLYVNAKRYQQAIDILSKAIPDDPDSQNQVHWSLRAVVASLFGCAHAGLGHADEARRYAVEAIELARKNRRDHVTVRHNVAVIHAMLSELESKEAYQQLAIEHLRRGLVINPTKARELMEDEKLFPKSFTDRQDYKLLADPPN